MKQILQKTEYQYNIYCLYISNGQRVKQDFKKAKKLYQKAAVLENA